ncbi:bacillithiol biosynthesis cysteine-adding enzyme BshC [Alkalihalobacillus deserti]|uniref:bacillithiol biosynthesis cysteine-adding enzyme BshC n=1 Tax=Alkalihalobacillus deserti TaxID=2879466 RepID=UPI001D151216|nr:bacillithiol biosynthesis cysteine-adding enzyme BshC [Alkalihalobacillus deserti]
MEVTEINLEANKGFFNDYVSGHKVSEHFFDYTYTDEQKYKSRMDHILTRTYQRSALADYFSDVHLSLPHTKEANIQIEKLRRPESVVVVGGQQAGLLTGPLYTVYKAMSIVSLAKQQEEELGIPVVPIFWIAGEDHDLDEIRYVYIEKNASWKKHMYNDTPSVASASCIQLNKKEMNKWLNGVFSSLPETAHTKSIIAKITDLLEKSVTITDFFKQMMNWFFGKEGLLLLDAHDPAIRKLEQNYFQLLIEDIEEVQFAQQQGAKAFSVAGYGEPIVTDEENAHLFLEVDGERRRLDFQDPYFRVRGTNQTWTKEQLIELLKESPHQFSNNVVTRPLMQEWLLPVLSFVAGPGELLYWATLKPVFNHFNVKIPPVVPRVQLTFVPVFVNKWLEEKEYNISPFLKGESREIQEAWLQEVKHYPIEEVIHKVRTQIEEDHTPLRQLAKEMNPTLAELSEKNLAILKSQIDFMERKMDFFIRQSHEQTLSKFTETGRWLAPFNRPQERVIHPILLMNVIGEDGLQRLLSKEMSLNHTHKIVYL